MLSDGHRARLHLYNEKADLLLESSFAKKIFGQPTEVNFSWEEGQGLQVTTTSPSGESVQAFVLTFRLFHRDGRERLSFRGMAELYAVAPTDLHDRFVAIRAALHRFLGEPGMCTVYDERLTHDRILNVFLYGGLAHFEADKQPVYELWRSQPIFALLEQDFVLSLGRFLSLVRQVKEVNNELLARS
jgi:hypothetical protein